MQNNQQTLFGQKIVTPAGRLSYPKIWKPESGPTGNEKPKFSTSLLVPKVPGILDDLTAKCKEVAVKFFGTKFKGTLTQFGQHCPIKDGDMKDDGDPANGHWILTASCGEKNQPFVMDANNLAIRDEDSIYGGCLAILYVQAMAYDVSGFKGVKLFLQAVQKIGDGERFGGGGDRFNPMTDAKKVEVPDYLRGALVASPPPRQQPVPAGVPGWSPVASQQTSTDALMQAALEAGDEAPF